MTDLLSDEVGTIYQLSQRIRNLEAQVQGRKQAVLLSVIDVGGLATVDITDVPEFYRALRFIQICRGTNAAATDYNRWRFNDDAGANYYRVGITFRGVGTWNVETIGGTELLGNALPGGTNPIANSWEESEMFFWLTGDGSVSVGGLWDHIHVNNLVSDGLRAGPLGQFWTGTPPISKVTIWPNSGSPWQAGSKFILYGIG